MTGIDRFEFTGDLVMVKNLGSGQFGTVDQMIAKGLDGKPNQVVAVKTLLGGTRLKNAVTPFS